MKAVHALVLGLTAVTIAGTSLVGAQPSSFDHLECYQIKDTLARGTARADLVPEAPPFLAALGCKIKLPAVEYCTRSSKQNLQPPAALSVSGDEPGDYFCYKVACPRGADLGRAPLDATDQFGRRTVFVRKPKRLCVPAVRPTPTPTPTSTPGHDPGCSFDGTECQGGCTTSGRCLWDPNQARCICPAAFDVDCGHAIGGCASGFCFGPNQQCAPIPNPTGFPCGCFPKPTATPP